MLGLEPASFLLIRFFVALSFTEQPTNKAVAVAAVDFKNCLLFILPSRKKDWVLLGLNWVCFPRLQKCHFFRNSLLILNLRSFGHPENWVCFA